MWRTVTGRLYPTKTQSKELERLFAEAARVYNAALEHRRTIYNTQRRPLSDRDMYKWLDRQSLNLPRDVAKDQVKRVQTALENFRRAVRQKKWCTYPRFHSPSRHDSITYSSRSYELRTRGRRVYIEGLGETRIRGIPDDLTTTQKLTIKRTADGTYLTVFVYEKDPTPKQRSDQLSVIGVDLGLANTVSTSDGITFTPSTRQRRIFRQLRKCVFDLAHHAPGSIEYKDGQRRINHLRSKLLDLQRSQHHEVASYLVTNFDVIGIEAINLRPMNGKLHGQTNNLDQYEWANANAGWLQLAQTIRDKAELASVRVIDVPAYNSSQECPSCGATSKKTLSDRHHDCACGLSVNRDQAAAMVILNRTLEQLNP